MSSNPLYVPIILQNVTSFLTDHEQLRVRETCLELDTLIRSFVEKLDLSGTSVSSVKDWKPFPAVSELCLDNTPFVDLSELPRVFPSLISLSVADCKCLSAKSWTFLSHSTGLIELFLSRVTLPSGLDLRSHSTLEVLWIDDAMGASGPLMPRSLVELNVTGWRTNAYQLVQSFPDLTHLGVANTGTPNSELVDLVSERGMAFIDDPSTPSGRLQTVCTRISTLDDETRAVFLQMHGKLCDLCPHVDPIHLLENATLYASLTDTEQKMVDRLALIPNERADQALALCFLIRTVHKNPQSALLKEEERIMWIMDGWIAVSFKHFKQLFTYFLMSVAEQLRVQETVYIEQYGNTAAIQDIFTWASQNMFADPSRLSKAVSHVTRHAQIYTTE
ncbi:MAG: hypothetical protein SP1CHLAM54_06510 [Chlamydiia bacterium]|nr:hypothetical protein [Chlamydiia bacterium]MCH9615561.1 hypothetical protein [Chlamydiia bacterium]MCH9629216.1 hypothetical protein [Chlamydiia bacterium]